MQIYTIFNSTPSNIMVKVHIHTFFLSSTLIFMAYGEKLNISAIPSPS